MYANQNFPIAERGHLQALHADIVRPAVHGRAHCINGTGHRQIIPILGRLPAECACAYRLRRSRLSTIVRTTLTTRQETVGKLTRMPAPVKKTSPGSLPPLNRDTAMMTSPARTVNPPINTSDRPTSTAEAYQRNTRNRACECS